MKSSPFINGRKQRDVSFDSNWKVLMGVKMKAGFRWLIIAVMLCGVVFLSNQPADQQRDFRPYLYSHSWTWPYIAKLPHLQFHYTGGLVDSYKDPIEFWGFFVPRKAFHFLSYGLLGLTFVWAWSGSGYKGWKAWIYGFMLLAIIAGSDELNQLLGGSGRTGCLEDVVLDISGFLVIGSIYAAFSALISKCRRNKYAG